MLCRFLIAYFLIPSFTKVAAPVPKSWCAATAPSVPNSCLFYVHELCAGATAPSFLMHSSIFSEPYSGAKGHAILESCCGAIYYLCICISVQISS